MKLKLTKVGEPFLFEFSNSNGNSLKIDAASVIGGGGNEFRPMELLAGSLASCMAIDVLHILRKQRISPKQFAVDIQASRTEGVPSPFDSIVLTIQVSSEIDKSQLERNIRLSLEKYCSVAASLSKDIQIETNIQHIS